VIFDPVTRPAQFHEKPPPKVGQTIVFCRLSSSALTAGRCFFGPVIPAEELSYPIEYVEDNPVKAGLAQTKERWRWSSAA
jgi:hypothetical protein